jgi:hypothetical protein
MYVYVHVCMHVSVCVCIGNYFNANICLSSFSKLLKSDSVSCTVFVPLDCSNFSASEILFR